MRFVQVNVLANSVFIVIVYQTAHVGSMDWIDQMGAATEHATKKKRINIKYIDLKMYFLAVVIQNSICAKNNVQFIELSIVCKRRTLF